MKGNVVGKTKLRARLVGAFGIIPGLLFLLANYTELGHKLYTGCGYWVLMLVAMGFVFLMYVFLVVKHVKAVKSIHFHTHSPGASTHQGMSIISIVIEALIVSAIIITSMLGFALFETRCMFGKYAPHLFEQLPLPN